MSKLTKYMYVKESKVKERYDRKCLSFLESKLLIKG